MTDDLIFPIFSETAKAQPDAPATGPAFGPGWTEAQHVAGLARAAALVRQVLARMPPPPVREAPPAIEVAEKTAFESAVAALVDADKW